MVIMLGLRCRTLLLQSLVEVKTNTAIVAGRRGFAKTRYNFESSTERGKANVSPLINNNSAIPPNGATTNASATAASTTVTATSSPSSSIWSFPKKNPFTFQMIIATCKTMAADLMVQTVAEGKSLDEVDWKRNGIFVVFGFVYLGGFQWWLMVNKYRQWFPTMDAFAKMSFAEKLKYPAGIFDAIKMVIFDVTIHLPIMYFPTYYAVKEFVGGESWNPIDWVTDGITKYRKNMVEDLTAMIKLWGPSDCVQFVLPIHIRMPFRHLVSFFWTAYVSFTRGAITNNNDTLPDEPKNT
jgi:hypothetical protein